MAELTLEQILGNPEGLSGAAGMLQGAEPRQRRALFGEFFEQAMPFLAPPGVMEAMEGQDMTMKDLMLLGVLGPLGGKGKGLRLIQGGRVGRPNTFDELIAQEKTQRGLREAGRAEGVDIAPQATQNKLNMLHPGKPSRGKESLENFSKDLMEEVQGRATRAAEKAAKHNWSVDIGDNILTAQGIRNNEKPFKVIGRVIRKKGLLPESDPRAGKFIHGKDVPYLRVRRGSEETEIPEWAVVRRLTGPEG